MGRPPKYTDDFKREAVRLLDEGQTLEEVAADLNVAHSSLSRWKKRFGPPSDSPPPTDDEGLRRENSRLRRKIRELEEEREILKKATAFFAKESK